MAIVWFASLGFVQFCRTRSHRLLCAAPTCVQPAGHAAACLADLRCPDAWAAFGGVASLCCGGADAYCFAVALSPCWFFLQFFFREKRILSIYTVLNEVYLQNILGMDVTFRDESNKSN